MRARAWTVKGRAKTETRRRAALSSRRRGGGERCSAEGYPYRKRATCLRGARHRLHHCFTAVPSTRFARKIRALYTGEERLLRYVCIAPHCL